MVRLLPISDDVNLTIKKTCLTFYSSIDYVSHHVL